VTKHWRWGLPLLCAPVVYVLAMLALSVVPVDGGEVGPALVGLLLLVVAVGAPCVLLAVSATLGARVYREHRRSRGRFTRTESELIARRQQGERAWHDAQRLRRTLLGGDAPPTLTVWDVIPHTGESFLCDVGAGYARYYGTVESYTRTSGVYAGRPAFVLAGLAATAIGNVAERSAAQSRARAQWREHVTCRLVVTDQRLLCHVRGRWLSFHYSGITALYPDVANRSLVCQFADTEPLLLWGDHAPFAAVMTVMKTHGREALSTHPGLGALSAAPA
jgi:hypothetical protein